MEFFFPLSSEGRNSKSEQMNLNTFADIKFSVGLRKEAHHSGRSQLLRENMEAGIDVPHMDGRQDVPHSHAASPLALNNTKRGRQCYPRHLVVQAIISSPLFLLYPLHILPSDALPFPLFPAGLCTARSNPGSNTIL